MVEILFSEKASRIQNFKFTLSFEYALEAAPNKTTYVYKITFWKKKVYIGFTSKPVEKKNRGASLAFDKANLAVNLFIKKSGDLVTLTGKLLLNVIMRYKGY